MSTDHADLANPAADALTRARVPQDGIDTWHAQLRDLIKASGYTAKEFGPAHGIAADAIQKHANPNATHAPSLALVHALDRGTGYSAAKQIKDLFCLEPHEMELRLPSWQPRISQQRLLDGLQQMLGWAEATAPSAYEIAETVLASCTRPAWASSESPDHHEDPQDLGRWRARIFDIAAGYHFGYLQARAVEFLRWHGAGLDADLDPGARAEEYLGTATRNLASRLAPVTSILGRTEVPRLFGHGENLTDAERAERWRIFRAERAELILRMGSAYGASPGEWLGGWGIQHTALLKHRDKPTGRHIWVTPMATSGATSADPQPLPRFPGITTVVLVGAPAVGYRHIGFGVARALGWNRISSNELANRVTGRRVSVYQGASADSYAAAFDDFARDPMPYGVLTVHLDNVFRHDGIRTDSARLLPAVERMLRADGVLPILLTPRPESQSLDLWERRAQTLASAGPEASLVNREAHLNQLYALAERMWQQIRGALTVQMQPTVPWSGPAVREDPEQPYPDWYTHPLLGDIWVRAAYEIARFLVSGSARTPDKPTGFAPGSVVARYEKALRACTGGPAWTDDTHLLFDPRYRTSPPPEDMPPRGVSVLISGTAEGEWLARPAGRGRSAGRARPA